MLPQIPTYSSLFRKLNSLLCILSIHGGLKLKKQKFKGQDAIKGKFEPINTQPF